MKFKLFITGLLSLTGSSLFAQMNFGAKAGVGLPTWDYSDQDYKPKTKTVTNFYLTGYASYNFKSNLGLQAGLSLEGRGGRIPLAEYKAEYLFVSVPVNVVYYIPTGSLGAAFVSAGPYAGINFGGEYTAGNGEGGTFTEDMDYGKYNQIERFDWGTNLGVGYKFSKGYLVNAGYNLGIQNLGTQSATESMRSRGLSFGIGYEF